MRCPPLSELPPPPPGKTGWPWTVESEPLPDTTANEEPWPRVGIVTPSYNQGEFLEESIRSVLLQGYPGLDYTVMDGGSTDRSVDIIEKYGDWLSHWRSEPDAGQADAIRRGFDLVQGEILAWLNSDDVMLPGALHSVGRYFSSHSEVDCVTGGSIIIDERGRVVRNSLGLPRIVLGTRETFTRLLLSGGLSFYQPASYWRREAYLAAGGVDASKRFVMDYDLYLRMARAKPFGHLDRLLACFRLHPGSKTSLLQPVRRGELAQLWDRYERDSVGSMYLHLFEAYQFVANVFRNLPVRIGVALGLVKLPYQTENKDTIPRFEGSRHV